MHQCYRTRTRTRTSVSMFTAHTEFVQDGHAISREYTFNVHVVRGKTLPFPIDVTERISAVHAPICENEAMRPLSTYRVGRTNQQFSAVSIYILAPIITKCTRQCMMAFIKKLLHVYRKL